MLFEQETTNPTSAPAEIVELGNDQLDAVTGAGAEPVWG